MMAQNMMENGRKISILIKIYLNFFNKLTKLRDIIEYFINLNIFPQTISKNINIVSYESLFG